MIAVAAQGKLNDYIRSLSPIDKRHYLWASVVGGSGFIVLLIARFLLFKGKTDTGSILGWTLLAVGLAVILLSMLYEVRLIRRGRAVWRSTSGGGES
jgi:hypothetical protein